MAVPYIFRQSVKTHEFHYEMFDEFSPKTIRRRIFRRRFARISMRNVSLNVSTRNRCVFEKIIEIATHRESDIFHNLNFWPFDDTHTADFHLKTDEYLLKKRRIVD